MKNISDEDRLQNILGTASDTCDDRCSPVCDDKCALIDYGEETRINKDILPDRYDQWTQIDKGVFITCSEATDTLSPGAYRIISLETGPAFVHVPIKTEGLLYFPQTNSEKVINEIMKFWQLKEKFYQHELTYKRGILLWGPPGSGKTCTIQILTADIVKRGGIVIMFSSSHEFTSGYRVFRKIQPKTPIICVMEDLDAILSCQSESEVINVLDGMYQLDNIVFVATTNYPERLGPRIVNRPSRFDKRFFIDHPNAESRKIYFEYLYKGAISSERIDKMVRDTETFSLAHMKELFVATEILGDDYDESLSILSNMNVKLLSNDKFRDPMSNVGFASKKGY